MNGAEITAALGALKYIVPALESAWNTLLSLLPQDRADIQAAVAAIEKAFSDLKGGFVILEAAIKAAFSGAPSATAAPATTTPPAA